MFIYRITFIATFLLILPVMATAQKLSWKFPQTVNEQSCKDFNTQLRDTREQINEAHSQCLNSKGTSGESGPTCTKKECQKYHMDGKLEAHFKGWADAVDRCDDMVRDQKQRERDAKNRQEEAERNRKRADEDAQRRQKETADEADKQKRDADAKNQQIQENINNQRKATQEAQIAAQKAKKDEEDRKKDEADRREKERIENNRKIYEDTSESIRQSDQKVNDQAERNKEQMAQQQYQDRSVVNTSAESQRLGLNENSKPLGTGGFDSTNETSVANFMKLSEQQQREFTDNYDNRSRLGDFFNRQRNKVNNLINNFKSSGEISEGTKLDLSFSKFLGFNKELKACEADLACRTGYQVARDAIVNPLWAAYRHAKRFPKDAMNELEELFNKILDDGNEGQEQ